MGRLANVLSLDDFEIEAKRLLPRCIFGFVSGGVESNSSRDANREAFADWAFVPRVLVNTVARSQATTLFGKHYNAPFGISPMGSIALGAFECERVLAAGARKAGIPFMLERRRADGDGKGHRRQSGGVVPGLYPRRPPLGQPPHRPCRARRLRHAGGDGRRRGQRQSREQHPQRLLDAAAPDATPRMGWHHPSALAGAHAAAHPVAQRHAAFRERHRRARSAADLGHRAALLRPARSLSWDDIAWIRERWKGTFIIKGILSPEDARKAAAIGADGIIVSNHGGRQLDGAIASLRALPDVVAAAGGLTVMLDSGIRRGTDVVKALALGASFVFLGRPFLYRRRGGRRGRRQPRHQRAGRGDRPQPRSARLHRSGFAQPGPSSPPIAGGGDAPGGAEKISSANVATARAGARCRRDAASWRRRPPPDRGRGWRRGSPCAAAATRCGSAPDRDW